MIERAPVCVCVREGDRDPTMSSDERMNDAASVCISQAELALSCGVVVSDRRIGLRGRIRLFRGCT